MKIPQGSRCHLDPLRFHAEWERRWLLHPFHAFPYQRDDSATFRRGKRKPAHGFPVAASPPGAGSGVQHLEETSTRPSRSGPDPSTASRTAMNIPPNKKKATTVYIVSETRDWPRHSGEHSKKLLFATFGYAGGDASDG